MARWQPFEPFFLLISVWAVICACLLLTQQSFAQDNGEPVAFYFIGNLTYAAQIGMTPSPYNASNITRFLPATNFPPGGISLCLTQAIPTVNNGSQDLEAEGRALYSQPIRLLNATTKSVLFFSTMFSFWIQTSKSIYVPGEGLAFILAADNTSTGNSGKYLGWLNETTNYDASGHNFAVEFDIFQDPEFGDINDNHVGININSLKSNFSKSAGYYPSADSENTIPLQLTDIEVYGNTIYAWIEYNGSTQILDVTINSNDNVKPPKPLISEKVDLAGVLNEFMYVGFTASTGDGHMAQHTVYDWSFNTSGQAINVFGIGTENSKKGVGFMVPVAVSSALVVSLVIMLLILSPLFFRWHQKYTESRCREFNVTELDHLEYGPHKFSYKDLHDATHKFDAKGELGRGGFGSVYKGILVHDHNGEVAVKRICKKSTQGSREFMAEVKIIGRMRHRNLVPLLGWCHEKSKGELLLVYEYMPKGSLDKLLFRKTGDDAVLSWDQRAKIVSGVATALQFLHEEYEQRVVHRDVKASNVMLDADFNARLGDFGLARLYDHSEEPNMTTHLAGTFGYMAPELIRDGKSTEKTDVYSFGAVALEIATGRSAAAKLDPAGNTLVDWVWSLFSNGNIMDAVDSSLGMNYDDKEMLSVLHTGLICSHPDSDKRPTMRQSLSYLKGEIPFAVHMLPAIKPLPTFALNSLGRTTIDHILHSTLGTPPPTESQSHVMNIDDPSSLSSESAR